MMKQLWLVFVWLLSCFSLSNQLDPNKRFPSPYGEKEKESKFWYSKAEEELKTALSRRFNTKTAKNVIIFLGDGMGVTVSTVGRIYKGQKKGFSGAEEYLAWEKFPDVSLIKTYNIDKQVPDSASTATAYLCGVKGNHKTIGVNANVQANNCTASLDPENRPDSILKWSQDVGKGTGVVTTTRITHATPTGTYGHIPHREWECDSSLPQEAKVKGCKDIARQLVEDLPGKNINVLLAGGRDPMGATLQEDGESSCKREDGRNLADEWISDKTKAGKSAVYVTNTEEFREVDPAKEDYILGLFKGSHMDYSYYRDKSPKGSPSIKEMTELAIKRLQREPKGFFLLVEGGKIDVAMHATKPRLALDDLVDFDEAVQAALNLVDLEETLVIVTADHSHTMTMNGYPSRDNNILGTTTYEWVTDKMPYTTLLFTDGFRSNFHLGWQTALKGGEYCRLNMQQL
ncbi:Alkaline phosphatase, tissue-nonspecific isozyme [Armadillidium nasatum]|uniref:Alkaline phosphatase n=1 Tax=Armadillidium nasatum TaxID=96803 RepID=A0A5N5SS08_9CRUS|nr:Alkaline phosphatase, tissue-nonspecific isozyme [Armadillidium nasatum]